MQYEDTAGTWHPTYWKREYKGKSYKNPVPTWIYLHFGHQVFDATVYPDFHMVAWEDYSLGYIQEAYSNGASIRGPYKYVLAYDGNPSDSLMSIKEFFANAHKQGILQAKVVAKNENYGPVNTSEHLRNQRYRLFNTTWLNFILAKVVLAPQ